MSDFDKALRAGGHYLDPSDPDVATALRELRMAAKTGNAALGPYHGDLESIRLGAPHGGGIDSLLPLFLADAETFLRRWSDQAVRLGWTGYDLFCAPQRHSVFPHLSCEIDGGLCWRLRGDVVKELWDDRAVLSTGETIARLTVASNDERERMGRTA
jgi:hypothetical protein